MLNQSGESRQMYLVPNLRGKRNQRNKRPVLWKLNINEKNQDDMKKWKTFNVYGLEEKILIKYLHYPKKSAHWMQIPIKTTNILHRTRMNNFEICMEPPKTQNNQRNFEKEK